MSPEAVEAGIVKGKPKLLRRGWELRHVDDRDTGDQFNEPWADTCHVL